MSHLDDIFSTEANELATDQSEACTSILNIVGQIAQKHSTELALWLLLATAAIGARAVNITPTQASTATRLIRKRVDQAVEAIGADSATASDIMAELHLPRGKSR